MYNFAVEGVQFRATTLFSLQRRGCSIHNGRGVQHRRRIQLRIVEINALLLGLDEHPKVELVPHEWMESLSGMRAAVTNDFKIIYLNDNWIDYSVNEFTYSLSHEMRHVWQKKMKPDLIASHRTLDLCRNVEEYSLQPSEVDAHAWAYIMVCKLTSEAVPLNIMLGEKVAARVEKRINDIYDEMHEYGGIVEHLGRS